MIYKVYKVHSNGCDGVNMVHHNEARICFKSFFLPLFNGISVRSGTLIMRSGTVPSEGWPNLTIRMI